MFTYELQNFKTEIFYIFIIVNTCNVMGRTCIFCSKIQ